MSGNSREAEKQARYYRRIAEQTGNLYLREIEAMSRLVAWCKEAESTLSEREQTLRNIIEHSNELFYLHDTEHRFSYVSPQCVDFFGYSPEEMKVKWTELMTDNPINREGFEITQRAILTGEKQKPYHLEGRKKDGGKILLEIEESPIKNDSGEVVMIAGAARDITERRRAEEEKSALEARLRHAGKMEAVGTIAGGIAHDFNNILAIIMANTELAIQDLSENAPSLAYLKEVRVACRRATDIVGQLLNFGRKSEAMLRPLDIRATVVESLQLVRSSIKGNVEIETLIDENAWPVNGDPTQINQILINLCMNAADAMHPGGGQLRVAVDNFESAAADPELDLAPGRYVRLVVSDNGVGIESETLERIFDPYFTTKDVGKGSGMGLAVVHGIVKNHGGRIKALSRPGRGTAMQIFFPAAETAPPAEAAAVDSCPTGTEAILFVDDEKAIVETYREQLTRLGYSVEGTTDPLKALERFRGGPQRFDLVITDMTMPLMTGDRLALEIMALRPDIPVILGTGYSERMDEKTALAKGFKAFVMKPYDLSSLANSIREVLDDSESARR